jgi:nanoRNase/pAp phosphatase (c-di-AMP/oligoRNAs hydrolase)
VPVVNAPYTAISEVVGELAEEEGVPFAVGWYVGASGNVVYSLRSKGSFNVAELAQKMGGGGHIKAAGFQSPSYPAFFGV